MIKCRLKLTKIKKNPFVPIEKAAYRLAGHTKLSKIGFKNVKINKKEVGVGPVSNSVLLIGGNIG